MARESFGRTRGGDWFAAIAALVVPGVCYVSSLSSFPAAWDTAELQTSAYVFGIPHATGFPFYLILGWLFSHTIPFGTVAWRINLLSATAGVVCCFLIFVLAREAGSNRSAGVFATWCFAFGGVVFQKATRADVHLIALALSLTAFYFSLRASKLNNARFATYAVIALGLGVATHPVVLFAAPAVFYVLANSRIEKSVRGIALLAAAGLAPLFMYCMLPARSAVIASLALDPSAAIYSTASGYPHSIVWDTNRTRFLSGFLQEVSGSEYNAAGTLSAIVNLTAFGDYASQWFKAACEEFFPIGAVFAISIAWLSLRANWRRAMPFVLFAATGVPFAIAYKSVEGDVLRYFLPSFAMLAVGISLLPSSTQTKKAGSRWQAIDRVAFLLVLAVLIFMHNRSFLASRNDTGGQGAIDTVAQSVPNDAVVIASWVDAPSLAYGRDVEHRLSNVILSDWPSSLVREIPGWRKSHRVFIFADANVEKNLADFIPAWLTRMPPFVFDSSHTLYEVCVDATKCVERGRKA